MDIFLCGHNQPAYGFELVVEANEKNFDEHLDRANYYSNLHGCSMYMINLCTDNKLTNNFGSKYPEVTSVHIIYDMSKGMADIVYEDYRKYVSIKRSAWKVAFD